MLAKYRTVLSVLVRAVPAGFFPIATLGAIWEFIRASSNTRKVRDPASTSGAVIAYIVVLALISLVALYVFQRALRRAGASDENTAYQLSGSAWKAMLWGGFATGLGFGVAMFVMMLH